MAAASFFWPLFFGSSGLAIVVEVLVLAAANFTFLAGTVQRQRLFFAAGFNLVG